MLLFVDVDPELSQLVLSLNPLLVQSSANWGPPVAFSSLSPLSQSLLSLSHSEPKIFLWRKKAIAIWRTTAEPQCSATDMRFTNCTYRMLAGEPITRGAIIELKMAPLTHHWGWVCKQNSPKLSLKPNSVVNADWAGCDSVLTCDLEMVRAIIHPL